MNFYLPERKISARVEFRGDLRNIGRSGFSCDICLRPLAENAGIIGLFVDAKDEVAKAYYERYGFLSLKDIPLELFIPLSTIRQLLEVK